MVTTAVRVELPSGLDPFTGGRRSIEVRAHDVAGVVAALDDRIPGLGGHLVDASGALRPHLLCLVDDELVRDVRTAVGPRVRFLIAVSGG